jgi:two-component system chemotaxis sensor kinase CheA/two-component system sensor histidine kinase and response regulator WspE
VPKERARPAGSSLRVDPERVAQLSDLLGDITLARNRIEHEVKRLRVVRAELRAMGATVLAKTFDTSLREIDEQQARLAALLATLDNGLREVRHVGLDTLFERIPRAARDVAEALGKSVGVHVSGESIEVDKQVIDNLAEPVLHVVRNAVDHGIEEPAVRVRAGKPERGRLSLHARRNRDRLELVIEDDGSGIDLPHLRAAAVRAGLIDQGTADTMTESAALDLVFAAGLSTRGEVSEFSGRGVGLDVVRARLGALGGDVSVKSEPGRGCTFLLSMPLRVAIARALVIEIGPPDSKHTERYALPTSSVLDVGRLEPEAVRQIAGAAAVPFRDQFALVADLAAILGSPERQPEELPRLVYVGQAKQVYALEVDRILGERELITRPLGGILQESRIVSAAAVLEDGRPALVLNVQELVGRAGVRVRGARKPTTASPSRRRVLVTEDSLITRSLIADALRAVGYDVAEAEHGVQALEKLSQGRFDLLLSDLEMPVMNGFELLGKVRSDERLRDLPVIVISSLGAPEDKRRALGLGATAYVVKSEFSERGLTDLVGRLVES